MSDTTKNGMDYGLSRDRFDTEEEFEEALALAESPFFSTFQVNFEKNFKKS